MSIFEKASRLKLRFQTPVGPMMIEDLWDLPLTSRTGRANLDDIARSLHKHLKSGDDVSFVETDRKSDETTQLLFDVVKHVIDTKLDERKREKENEELAAKKQRIMQILSERKDKALEGKSDEELQAELATP